jgi:hypothetical protein
LEKELCQFLINKFKTINIGKVAVPSATNTSFGAMLTVLPSIPMLSFGGKENMVKEDTKLMITA